jgi:membrane-bound lytic murein transglycosylase A
MTHIRLLLILLAAACAPAPQKPTCPCPPPKPEAESARYEARAFSDLPGWNSAQLEPSLRAFVAGCARFKRVCDIARGLPAGDERAARSFFETEFVPYALVSSLSGDSGLVTGYYEPIIDGSRAPGPVHRFPIFGVPQDLIVVDLPETKQMRLRGRLDGRRLVPYYSRGEIDARGEAFPAPVIAWSADPVELFFLQIQGSGQVRLESGERIRVGFAEQNGHPYRSLGRHLVERGEMLLEQASMQGIKAWAAANPQKLQEALNQNPSYVFFRELAPTDGPIGALNIPLHTERSLAVDRRYVPLGAPVYLATTFPLSEEPLQRLMAAHDTGGAIRGVVRADFFWGTGPDAGAQAGRMRQQGRMWLLLPIGEPLPPGPAGP